MVARKILVRCLFVGAVCGFTAIACQGPEPYYRETDTGLAGAGPLGTGGSVISGVGGDDTGAAGSTGVAGSLSGVAGSTGAAGSGPAGSTGVAGASSGAAGSSAGGSGPGAAGSSAAGSGPAGSTGAAGAAAGRGGSTGAAGAAAGRGGSTGAAGMARGGSTGTAGAGKGGSTGAAGSVAPPPAIQVVAKCQSMSATNVITIHFKILNLSNMAIPFSTITARYVFTLEDPAMTVPDVEFDYLSALTKAQILVTKTATYVEFGFTGAGNLQAFDNISGTGEIQARIHPPNYSPSAWDTNQVNDPSYKACTGTTYDPRPGFIGYVGGRQSWPAPTP